MRRWPLPLQPRFIVYTVVLVITAILLFEYIFEFTSFLVGIPLLVFGILAIIGTIDLIQTQRAKQALDKRPFGTQSDVYSTGFEWLHHSIAPKPVVREPFRVVVGGPDCSKPYSASVFNISAMSFGALSPNAIRALNIGAKRGNFAHDTGEGGYSSYHRENGGDVIWEIGSGYFSCRDVDG